MNSISSNNFNISNTPTEQTAHETSFKAKKAYFEKINTQAALAALSPKARFEEERRKEAKKLLEKPEVIQPSPASSDSSEGESLSQSGHPSLEHHQEAAIPPNLPISLLRRAIVIPEAPGRLGRMAASLRQAMHISSFNDAVRHFADLDEEPLSNHSMLSETTNRALERTIIKTVPAGRKRHIIQGHLITARREMQTGAQEAAKRHTIEAITLWRNQNLKQNRRFNNAIAIRELAIEWVESQQNSPSKSTTLLLSPPTISKPAEFPSTPTHTESASSLDEEHSNTASSFPAESVAPSQKTWDELVAEHGGKTSTAIETLRNYQGPIESLEVKESLSAIINAAIKDKAQRAALTAQLKKMDTGNSVETLKAIARALGSASSEFQIPNNFQELGMFEQRKILVRQREINEAEEACQFINAFLNRAERGSKEALMEKVKTFVAIETDPAHYKTDAAIQLWLELSQTIMPGPLGKTTKGILENELKKPVEERGYELGGQIEAIGMLLQQNGQMELGTALVNMSYSL